MSENISDIITKNKPYPVLEFNPEIDRVEKLDLSRTNVDFSSSIYTDMDLFNSFIDKQIQTTGSKYLMGGYKESREMYSRSSLFDTHEEPRSLHLGIDIWGPSGTKIYSPFEGIVHSTKFNNNYGDYGATIIVKYQLQELSFYILYGHLALVDIEKIKPGDIVQKGEQFAHFGPPEENGHWPPHLHFQLIMNIGDWEGDYPGVCKPADELEYCKNSPDPAVLFQFFNRSNEPK